MKDFLVSESDILRNKNNKLTDSYFCDRTVPYGPVLYNVPVVVFVRNDTGTVLYR